MRKNREDLFAWMRAKQAEKKQAEKKQSRRIDPRYKACAAMRAEKRKRYAERIRFPAPFLFPCWFFCWRSQCRLAYSKFR